MSFKIIVYKFREYHEIQQILKRRATYVREVGIRGAC